MAHWHYVHEGMSEREANRVFRNTDRERPDLNPNIFAGLDFAPITITPEQQAALVARTRKQPQRVECANCGHLMDAPMDYDPTRWFSPVCPECRIRRAGF